jgi:hypothetical protein
MPTLREEMISLGLLRPQSVFQDNAVELERGYEAASTRLAEYDAKRKAAREAELKKVAKPKPPSLRSQWANNRDGTPVDLVSVAVKTDTTEMRRNVEAPALPLTRREQRLLNRIAQKNLSPEERQKAQRAFDHSRHLQELLNKRAATKRLNREAEQAAQAAKGKKRPKQGKLWISLPSKCYVPPYSSLFVPSYSGVRQEESPTL